MRALLLAALWVHLVSCVRWGRVLDAPARGQPPAPTAPPLGSDARERVASGSCCWRSARDRLVAAATAVFENVPRRRSSPAPCGKRPPRHVARLLARASRSLIVLARFWRSVGASRSGATGSPRARGAGARHAALALTSASSHAAAIPRARHGPWRRTSRISWDGSWVGGSWRSRRWYERQVVTTASTRRAYAVPRLRRFSRAALGVMLVLMASGRCWNAIAQVESIAGPWPGRRTAACSSPSFAVLVPILVPPP